MTVTPHDPDAALSPEGKAETKPSCRSQKIHFLVNETATNKRENEMYVQVATVPPRGQAE